MPKTVRVITESSLGTGTESEIARKKEVLWSESTCGRGREQMQGTQTTGVHRSHWHSGLASSRKRGETPAF